ISPWRKDCERAGPHQFSPPHERCWEHSRSMAANRPAPLRNSTALSNSSPILRASQSNARGRKRSEERRVGKGCGTWRAGPCRRRHTNSDRDWSSDVCSSDLHLALAEGLRACWSTPIFSTTREVLGTFALYGREPAGPAPEQHSIVEQFAHLASIAIERTRAQEIGRASCRERVWYVEGGAMQKTTYEF